MTACSSIVTNRNTLKARVQTREAKIHRLKLMNDGSGKQLATVYRRFRAAVKRLWASGASGKRAPVSLIAMNFSRKARMSYSPLGKITETWRLILKECPNKSPYNRLAEREEENEGWSLRP